MGCIIAKRVRYVVFCVFSDLTNEGGNRTYHCLGLAFQDDSEQAGDMATPGGDVREGQDCHVVLPMADILYGVQ